MNTTTPFDQFFTPQAGWLTPAGLSALLSWSPSEELQKRIEVLGEKANTGTLSNEEEAEYREYLDDAETISLMQASARRNFSQ